MNILQPNKQANFDFDTQKLFLGVLCKRNHNWNNTGNSLRYSAARSCVECARERSKLKNQYCKQFVKETRHLGGLCRQGHDHKNTGKSLRSKTGNCIECSAATYQKRISKIPKIDLNQTTYYLGVLCKRGHDWDATGSSRRYSSTGACIECNFDLKTQTKHIARRIKYAELNREKRNEDSRNRYAANREKNQAKSREYYQLKRLQISEYNKTPKGKLALKRANHKRRALKKGSCTLPYSSKELKIRIDGFNSCCCYCGEYVNKLTIDHFIPLSKQGKDEINNIVGACASCNSSKNNQDPRDWYKSKSFYNEQRWQNILYILGLYPAIPSASDNRSLFSGLSSHSV